MRCYLIRIDDFIVDINFIVVYFNAKFEFERIDVFNFALVFKFSNVR